MSLNKSQVQRQFDRSAVNYDAIAGMQRDIVDELLSAGTASPRTAIDLGCGTGYGLVRLAELSRAELFGADIAPGMLDLAAQACNEAMLTLADIESLPYASNSFDLSLSCSAVQWCELDIALAEIKRITVPGGQILLSSFLQGTLAEWRRLWGLGEARRFLSLAQFKLAFNQLGLKDTRIWTKTYSQRFFSFSDAVSSVRDLGAGNAGSETTKGLMGKRQFQNIKEQINRQIKDQGYVDLPYEVVFVSAKKEGCCV